MLSHIHLAGQDVLEDSLKRNLKAELKSIKVKDVKQDVDRSSLDSLNTIRNYFKRNFNSLQKSGNIGFSADFSLKARYTNFKDTELYVPPSYILLQARPVLSIGRIPFTSTFQYSTDKGLEGRNLKNINLSLDQNQLRQNITKDINSQRAHLNTSIKRDKYVNKQIDLSAFEIKDTLGSFVNSFPEKETYLESAAKQLSQLEKLSNYSDGQMKRYYDSIKIFDPDKIPFLDSMLFFKQVLSLDSVQYHRAMDSLEVAAPAKYNQVKMLKDVSLFRKKANSLSDIDKNMLNDLGFISKAEKILLDFKRLAVGDIYPFYSRLTFMGVKLRGADILYNPGKYTFNVTGGTTTQVRTFTKRTFKEINDRVYAGSFGYEIQKECLLKISYIDITRRDTSHYYKFNSVHQRNQILDLQTDLKLWNGLYLKTQIAHSLINNGNNEQVRESRYSDSTRSGNAYSAQLIYKISKTGTTLSSEIRRITPTYKAFTVPFLRTDIQQLNIKFSNHLFKKQILAEAFWTQEQDNLKKIKPNTSTFSNFGGTVNMSFNKLPYLLIGYQPIKQTIDNDIDTLFLRTSFSALTAQTGYQYNINKVICKTGFGYILQKENSEGISDRVESNVLYAYQFVKLSNTTLLNLTYTTTQTKFNSQQLRSSNLDGSITYNSSSKTVALGCYYLEQIKNTNNRLIRYAPYCTLMFTLLKVHSVSIQYTYIHLTKDYDSNYSLQNATDAYVKYIIKI